MHSNQLSHIGRLLAAGAVVLSLTGCQAMTPLLSPPELSVEYPTTSSSAYQFYGDKKCKTKSDTTHSPGVSNGSKPTGPKPLSIPAAPRIERAITALRPPAPAVSPGAPKSIGKGH